MKEQKSNYEIILLVEEIYQQTRELNRDIYNSPRLRAAYKAGIWEGLLHYYDIKLKQEKELKTS